MVRRLATTAAIRTTRHRLRFVGALTALLLSTAVLSAFDVAPAVAATTATFSNPAAIQGQDALGFGANPTPITMSASGTPVGSTYPSTIHLSGVPGKTTFVEIQMNLEHTAPDDVDILLVSPAGKAVVLMSDAGGFGDYSGGLGFSTNSVNSMPDTGPLDATFYAATNYVGNDVAGDSWPAPAPAVADPNAPLSSLNGDSPNGDWKLFVRDDQDQDGGALPGGWNLTVSTDATPTPAATYPASLPVSGLPGTVTDVNLSLKGLNWFPSADLDVMLVAPDGRKALVLSDIGSDKQMSDVNLTLDDEATSPLPDTTAPTSGRYRPRNLGAGDSFPAPAPDASTAGSPLSVFDGANPNGTWKLYVVDDSPNGSAGFLSAGWSLTIATSGNVAPRITSTTPKAGGTGVPTYANTHATASKALAASTVTSNSVYLHRAGSSVHVAATVSYLAGTHTLVIDPSRRLLTGTSYVVVVTTNVRDTAGHRLDQDPTKTGNQSKTWTFRTT